MVDGEYRSQFSSLEYLRFIIGFWIEVDRVPAWVTTEHCRWYQAFRREHGRSYFGAKEFHGDGVTYRVDHVPQGTTSQEDLSFFVKVSWRDSTPRRTSPVGGYEAQADAELAKVPTSTPLVEESA